MWVTILFMWFFFFKQKTAYEMRISDWSSDVCSSDLSALVALVQQVSQQGRADALAARGREQAEVDQQGIAMQRGPVEIDVATPDRLTLPFHDQVFGLRITLQPVPVLQRELVAQERRAHRFRPRPRVPVRRACAGVGVAQE